MCYSSTYRAGRKKKVNIEAEEAWNKRCCSGTWPQGVWPIGQVHRWPACRSCSAPRPDKQQQSCGLMKAPPFATDVCSFGEQFSQATGPSSGNGWSRGSEVKLGRFCERASASASSWQGNLQRQKFVWPCGESLWLIPGPCPPNGPMGCPSDAWRDKENLKLAPPLQPGPVMPSSSQFSLLLLLFNKAPRLE